MEAITRYGDVGQVLQQKGIEITIIEGQPRAIVRNISPIHTYHARGQLTNEQFSAGAELYRCYYHGMIESFGTGCTMNFMERMKSGLPENSTDFHWDCFKKYLRGLKAAGKNDYHVLRICCHEIPISSIVRDWKERKRIKEMLKESLNKIAKEFGIVS